MHHDFNAEEEISRAEKGEKFSDQASNRGGGTEENGRPEIDGERGRDGKGRGYSTFTGLDLGVVCVCVLVSLAGQVLLHEKLQSPS
jgi:hypothetical protein